MMQALMGAETICVLYLTFYAVYRMLEVNAQSFCAQPPTPVDYLYKISRVTGESEYNIFVKSAEDWRLHRPMVERDFRRYLSHQVIPPYVHDFIRKNKEHIDDLRMPMF
jgi:hypothetical protein